MADWYVDPSASGANNGTSQTDAWVSIVSALASTSTVAGDIIWCKGSQTLTAHLTQVAAISGLIFRATNASWVSDGTRFVIDGATSYQIFNWGTARSNQYEYFTLRRAATGAYYGTTGNNVFVGCLFELNPVNIGSAAGSAIAQCYRTVFRNNTIGIGGASLNLSLFDSCIFHNNTTAMTTAGFNNKMVNCHVIDNANGIVAAGGFQIDNCVLDGNTNYAVTTATGNLASISRSRITNNGIGITTGVNGQVLLSGCVVSDNTTNQTTGTGGTVKLLGDTIVANGLSGYIDRANKNFGLLPDATLRRLPQTPIEGTLTVDYVTAGITGADIKYPRIDSFDKTVLPTSGGTLVATGIGLTGANLYPWTLGGVACTVAVDSDTQITITVPAITAGLKSLAGTTTAGAVSITNAVTVQAGASAPGAFVLTATPKARGNMLLKWTPSTGFNSYDVYVNGTIPTGYADLVVCEKIITLTADSSNTIYVKAKNGTGNTDSNTLTVATGKSASIVAGITNNIVQELQQITIANGYTFTVNTVEQERMTERINNRLPMLEVCGPAVSIETKTTRGQQYTTGYSIIYRALINDDTLTDDPATKQTEDIAADIIMALMDDYTHGGLAIMTTVTDYYHMLDEAANGTTMFNVIVTFEILTHVDMFNPYKIG